MSDDLVPYEDIATFFDEGWITDVLFEVKSGKEATVYCCRAHPNHEVPYFAMKVYKPLEQRGFRNDAIYQEGRFGGDSRPARAFKKKTGHGRKVQFNSWLTNEFQTLQRLHAAGADVPQPMALGEKGLLLGFIGEGDQPAPTLSRVHIKAEEAAALFTQAIRNIELMLKHHTIHGDLSPYNILYTAHGLVIIDFPQSADARTNSSGRVLLERDVQNVCRYFAKCRVPCEASAITSDLWDRYQRAKL